LIRETVGGTLFTAVEAVPVALSLLVRPSAVLCEGREGEDGKMGVDEAVKRVVVDGKMLVQETRGGEVTGHEHCHVPRRRTFLGREAVGVEKPQIDDVAPLAVGQGIICDQTILIFG
jgi:hypothetical protein